MTGGISANMEINVGGRKGVPRGTIVFVMSLMGISYLFPKCKRSSALDQGIWT